MFLLKIQYIILIYMLICLCLLCTCIRGFHRGILHFGIILSVVPFGCDVGISIGLKLRGKI